MEPPADDNSPTVQQPLMDVTETDAYREKIIAFVNPKSYVDIIETEYSKNFMISYLQRRLARSSSFRTITISNRRTKCLRLSCRSRTTERSQRESTRKKSSNYR